MPRFHVVWPKETDDAFLNLWLQADSAARARLTKISHQIQAWLGVIPQYVGVPIGSAPGMRVWVLPLDHYASVIYHVNEQDRRVTIVSLSLKT